MAARYYDGVTADVQDVTLKVTSHELLINRSEGSGVVARWPISDMVVLGDSHHEAVPPLALPGSEARLVVEDPAWRAQLVSLVPALKPLALEPVKVAPRLGAYSLAIVALVGLFWSAIEYGTEYAVPLLPYTLQAKLGETVLDELLADKDTCQGRAGLTAINRLANDLAREAGYSHEVTVHIVEGGPVNAFTLPGSILVFYSDLITQAKDSSQVAGVLAHEIGHVVHDHPIKGVARAYGIDLLFKVLTGGYSDILSTFGTGGGALLAMRNGRAFEREADATGVRLLEQRGLRADGVSTFFEQMLEKEPSDAASAAGIWSSHPPTRERIEATKRPPTGRPAFSAGEWQALRNVCK
ncbi:M48 family metallopeptidase [Reyranella sp.]|uniref:M48 family metallopeptidase n=1 Tax=Reyranella sp. TaxID=1929291 RepID=UPI003BA85F3A